MPHQPSKGFSGAQLARIHGNRQGRRQPLPLADVLARTAPASSADNHQARRVFEAISEVVDDAFRRECCFDEFRGGEVILLVKQRQVLYHIRTLWHARLMAHLQRALPRRVVRRITFKAVDPDRPGGAAFGHR